MSDEKILIKRLREAGCAVKEMEKSTGEVIAIAGLFTLEGDSRVFAKTLFGPGRDVFPVEAAGLTEPPDNELDGAGRLAGSPSSERGKTSTASKAGSPIRQAGIGSATSDIRNGGMRDAPYGQPPWAQSQGHGLAK